MSESRGGYLVTIIFGAALLALLILFGLLMWVAGAAPRTVIRVVLGLALGAVIGLALRLRGAA